MTQSVVLPSICRGCKIPHTWWHKVLSLCWLASYLNATIETCSSPPHKTIIIASIARFQLFMTRNGLLVADFGRHANTRVGLPGFSKEPAAQGVCLILSIKEETRDLCCSRTSLKEPAIFAAEQTLGGRFCRLSATRFALRLLAWQNRPPRSCSVARNLIWSGRRQWPQINKP